jgi:HNH endonuclease
MMTDISSLTRVTDAELLIQVTRAAAQERSATAYLIALLAELDARRLYLGEGCSSLFTYCTQVLHLSEHASYGRIEAARAARRCPIILEMLAEGAVTLTTITLLAPHLTADNGQALLTSARHRTRREVEHIVAALRPLPPVPSSVRKLPPSAPRGGSPPPREPADRDVFAGIGDDDSGSGEPASPSRSQASLRPAVVTPLAPERYKVQVTVSRETYDRLRRAQELLRHVVPDGDPVAILDRALALLVADLEKTRLAAADRPRPVRDAAPGSRHVPAGVKRAVWTRDGGRCAFVGAQGRCTERGFLEVHHVVPFAAGGRTSVENCALRCRTHNSYEAELFFGPSVVREERAGYGATRFEPSARSWPSVKPDWLVARGDSTCGLH